LFAEPSREMDRCGDETSEEEEEEEEEEHTSELRR